MPAGHRQLAASAAAVAVWLLATAAVVLGATAGGAAVVDEDAIMLKFRRAVASSDPLYSLFKPGWQTDNPAHHCSWAEVECDKDGHVVNILLTPKKYIIRSAEGRGSASGPGAGADNPLIPELAQLPRLEWFVIFHRGTPSSAFIPDEWVGPHSFPRLQRLSLTAHSLTRPLPDIQPGALPSLLELHLLFHDLRSTLPASWGSHPSVLPSLHTLLVQTPFAGHLPPEWGRGFRRLEILELNGNPSSMAPGMENIDSQLQQRRAQRRGAVQSSGPNTDWRAGVGAGEAAPTAGPVAAAQQPVPVPVQARRVPAEWATGFPVLRALMLSEMGLAGPFPPELITDGARAFPSLTNIKLAYNNLSGTLPPLLLKRRPALRYLELLGNQLSGSLPPEWGASQAWKLDLSDNRLTGSIIPPAWLEPGAMPQLSWLKLAGNPGLAGTLPVNLSWPQIKKLDLFGTGARGSVPEAWCQTLSHSGFGELIIGATGVEPRLPACAARSLSSLKLRLHQEPYMPALNDTAADNRQRRPGPVPFVAGLAAYCAVAAAALAASLHFRHWRQRRQWLPVPDSQTLSSAGPHQLASDAFLLQVMFHSFDGGSSTPSSSAHTPLSDAVVPGSTNRLAALLATAAAAAGMGKQPVPLRLLPAEELHRAVAQGLESQHFQLPALGSTFGARGALAPRHASTGSGSVAHGPQAEGLLPPRSLPDDGVLQPAWMAKLFAAQLAAHPSRKQQETPPPISAASSSWASWSWSLEGSRSRSSSMPGPGSCCPSVVSAPGSSPASSQQWPLPTDSLRMSPGDLQFVLDNSGLLVELGAGSHAAVYLAMFQGMAVAGKVFVQVPGLDLAVLWKEAELMARCCLHPRIVPLLGIVATGPLIVLAMKLMHGGSLLACLRDPAMKQRLKWAAGGRQVALDMAEGLEHLHSMQVMHSDLKASNVLLSAEGRASISDLGMAQMVTHSDARTAAGFTQAYAAPEQLLGQRCTLAADVYSLGVLLIELTTLQPAEKRRDFRLPLAPLECPQEVVDLIQECLSADPQQRPTAAQALQRLQAAGAGG